MTDHILATAKFYAALVGSAATAIVGDFAADSTEGKVLTAVIAIATAVATFAIPNKEA